MSEFPFAWFAEYGLAAGFAVLVLTAIGAPIPASLFLLALGSFVAQGELELWLVLVVATLASICGDQIGYALGRLAGRPALDAIARRVGAVAQMRRAEQFTKRWGAPGIFFSRWLVGSLGPWVNLTSGVGAYPWPRFLFWDALGETVWVGLYVTLGLLFSDRVRDLAVLLGNLGWLVVALLLAALSGWELARHFRRAARHALPGPSGG